MGPPENAYLWILEEGVLVVDAAPTAVLLRVLMSGPGTAQPGLLPGFMDAQVRCIDQAALDDVSEVSAHILEGHPGQCKGLGWACLPIQPTTYSSLNHNVMQNLHCLFGLSFLVCKMGMNIIAAYLTEVL